MKFRRITAIILSLVIVSSVSLFSLTVYAAAVVNSLPNVSFENITGGIPTDWSCGNVGTAATISIDSTNNYDGEKSVKIHCGSTGDQYVMQKWYIPVIPGDIYQAGVFSKTALTAGNGTLNLYFYNSSYGYLKAVSLKTGSGTNDWQYMGGIVTVPVNAAYVTFELNVSSATGDLWWDAAEFIKTTQKVSNADFESWTGGIPTDWSAGNLGTGAIMSADSITFNNGSKSVKVISNASSDQYVLQKWYIPVEQGDRFEFSAYHKTQNWTGSAPRIIVYFYNSSYSYISSDTFWGVSGTHNWSYLGGNSIVPNGAAFVTIELSISGAVGTMWWDTSSMGQVIHPIRDLGILSTRPAILSAFQISGGRFLVGANSSAVNGAAQIGVVSDSTGSVINTYDLTGTNSNGVWAMTAGFDAKVYIGTFSTSGNAGSLYRMDPSNLQTPELLGQPITGEKYIWALTPGYNAASSPGIYGGTSPGGKLFFYNVNSGAFTNLGTAYSGCEYIRSIARAPNGLIFCGLGTPAKLVAYNPATGTFSGNLIPSAYDSYTFTYYLNEINGKIAATVLDNNGNCVTLLYNPDNLGQTPTVASTALVTVIKYDSLQPNKVYAIGSGVRDYDITTNTYTTLVSNLDYKGGMVTGVGLTELNKTGYPAKSITGITSLGREWHCSPATGNQETVDFSIKGYGMGIDSLCSLGGKIYGGTYMIQELSYYDPSSDTFTELGMPINNGGEIYTMSAYNSKLYMGSYTEAVLSVYNPASSWNPGSSTNSNPRRIGTLDASQYRPYCSVVGSDNKIYIGSAPAYGLTGGALSRLDPSTEQISLLYRYTSNDDVTALAAGNGVLFGGTSSGKFFIWNIANGNMQYAADKARGLITSIRVSGSDVYVATNYGYLMIYNTASGWVYDSQITPGEELRSLAVGNDNNVYAISNYKFIKINAVSKALKTLFDTGTGVHDDSAWFNTVAVDSQGRVYFGANERLKVYSP